jgi:rhamnogalacturonyl hydrolase YesR
MTRSFDRILADPPEVHLSLHLGPGGYRDFSKADCLKRWCWSDALFMAPATWIGLSRSLGDPKYRDYALKEFWDSTSFLYDPAEQLYFRDSRFFGIRDPDDRKIFWSRGNGWVFAGMAQMMDQLPAGDSERAKLADHFRKMAARVVRLQKADGYWPSSLLSSGDETPESSGTALFTYCLAWGINSGLLPRAKYEPAVRLGWQALDAAVQPDGRLGWVQGPGDRPAKAVAEGSQIYATGAYLLAAAVWQISRQSVELVELLNR